MWEKIARVMQNKGITIYRLCKDLNLPATSGYRWKKTGKIGSAAHLYMVAKYLQVSVEELM